MTRIRLFVILTGVASAAVGGYLALAQSPDTSDGHTKRRAATYAADDEGSSSPGERRGTASSGWFGTLLGGAKDHDHEGSESDRRRSASGSSSEEGAVSRRDDKHSTTSWFGRLFGADTGQDAPSGRTSNGASVVEGPGGVAPGNSRRPGATGALAPLAPGERAAGAVGPRGAGNADPGSAGPGAGNGVYASTAGSADLGADNGPGTSPCTTGTANAKACLACEAANCAHDPKRRPYCEDFTDPNDQGRCQAVLDCIRQSNCIATGSVSCYCGADENVVTCGSSPISPNGGRPGAHGDCLAEILAGFPQGSESKSIINHLVDVTTPAGAALSQGQCDYVNCGDLTGTNECVPYCK